jgi:hypothetical protein
MEGESDSHIDRHGLRPFQKGDDARRGHGPKPGAPNAGRPPDAVRAACREAFADRVSILTELADKGTPDIRLRALDMLGRYGLGTSFTLDATDAPTGVIVLPPLELRDLQDARGFSTGSPLEEIDYEYVIEDLTLAATPEDLTLPATPKEATVDPEIVRQVLERRSRRST